MRALWPVLLAAVISLFPFTIYSTFLVPLAETSGQEVSVAGVLRGLGGIAAVLVGVAAAPLVARLSARHTTAAGLVLLAVSGLVATIGTLPALVLFCLGTGAVTAVLTPTLLRIAVATYPRRGDSGRAATIVTATQSLAAVLAAPLIGAVGLWRGWQGALWVTAGAAVLIAALALRSSAAAAATTSAMPALGYVESFRRLSRRRDLLAVIAIAFLRTTSFMGYLALLAAHYHQQFDLDPIAFTLVWTLSGASFFAGNFLAGRWARGRGVRHRRLLWVGLVGAAIAVAAVFTTDLLVVALVATAVMGFSHAVVAAILTTLIAGSAGELTAPTYSISAAGMSLGVFTGAVAAGLGLHWGGGPGMALALSLPTLFAAALVPAAARPPQIGTRDRRAGSPTRGG